VVLGYGSGLSAREFWILCVVRLFLLWVGKRISPTAAQTPEIPCAGLGRQGPVWSDHNQTTQHQNEHAVLHDNLHLKLPWTMQFALTKTNFSDQWFNELSPDSEKCCLFRSQLNLQQPDLWGKMLHSMSLPSTQQFSGTYAQQDVSTYYTGCNSFCKYTKSVDMTKESKSYVILNYINL